MNSDAQRLLVTGGAGFIGSALVEMLLARPEVQVLNLDKVTYAANSEALERFAQSANYRFVRGDICDRPLVERLLAEFRPQAIIHLAAESHVDRSIDDAAHASNNYGPRQFPEKLIPLMIIKASRSQELPVYGKGDNVRDWMHVSDHVRGLLAALERGKVGQTYNLGGGVELNNLELVRLICRLLDKELAGRGAGPHEELITFVPDRPGHDQRATPWTSPRPSGSLSGHRRWSFPRAWPTRCVGIWATAPGGRALSKIATTGSGWAWSEFRR